MNDKEASGCLGCLFLLLVPFILSLILEILKAIFNTIFNFFSYLYEKIVEIVVEILPKIFFIFGQIFLLITIVFAIGTSILGIALGIKNYIKIVKEAWTKVDLKRYKGSKKYKTDPIKILKPFYEIQPAKLLYFYDAGWYVMKYVIKNIWQSIHDDASKVFNWAKLRFSSASSAMYGNWFKKIWACLWYYAPGIGTFIGGGVYYVVAIVIVSIFLVLQFVLTIIGAIVTSILMAILGIGNYLFSKFYGAYFRCPECHKQMKIPTYTCKKCNQDHTRLWPSIYGLFHHTCRHNLSSGDVCNNSLPTLPILGRDRLLPKKCPSCNHPLPGVGGTNAHIPIVGSRNAGKSRYTVMATKELIEYASGKNFKISFPNDKDRETYEANIKRLKSGVLLNATPSREGGAKGYNLEVTKNNQEINHLLYLYDTAGEDISSDEKGREQESYFKYVHGVLLIVDPFKIPQVYETYKNKLNNININSEEQNLDATFRRILDLFETVAQKGIKNKFSQPIAIVINKTDLNDLEQKIGSYAASKYMVKNPTCTNELDAIDALVEEFLNNNGESNFVANLRLYFSNVRFFSSSALGSPDSNYNNSLKGIRVLEPMLWLMEQTKTLPNKASLGARIFRSKIFVNYGLIAITSTIMVIVLSALGWGGYSFLSWFWELLQQFL